MDMLSYLKSLNMFKEIDIKPKTETSSESPTIRPILSYKPKGSYYHTFETGFGNSKDVEMSYKFGLRNYFGLLDMFSLSVEKKLLEGETLTANLNFPFFHKKNALNFQLMNKKMYLNESISNRAQSFGVFYVKPKNLNSYFNNLYFGIGRNYLNVNPEQNQRFWEYLTWKYFLNISFANNLSFGGFFDQRNSLKANTYLKIFLGEPKIDVKFEVSWKNDKKLFENSRFFKKISNSFNGNQNLF